MQAILSMIYYKIHPTATSVGLELQKETKRSYNGPKWPKTAQNGPIWLKTVQNDLKWQNKTAQIYQIYWSSTVFGTSTIAVALLVITIAIIPGTLARRRSAISFPRSLPLQSLLTAPSSLRQLLVACAFKL